MVAELPLVSVLIPAHNAGRFIEQTMKSVLTQTMHSLECIVVNDGSTDNTREIVSSFLGDARVVLVDLAKVGLCGALNHGLNIAKAPLVARMDADDVMLPERLEKQLQFLKERPEIGGAGSFYWLIDENNARIGDGPSRLTSVEAIEQQLQDHGQLIYPHPTIMFRKEVVNALGGYRQEYYPCEDVDLFIRMLEIGSPILIQPEYLLNFRAHSQSVSANNGIMQFHLNRLILHNHRLRLSGKPELEVKRYFEQIETATGIEKFAQWSRLQSFLAYRRAARARTGHRPLLANGLLLAATMLNPYDAFWKMRRTVRARLA